LHALHSYVKPDCPDCGHSQNVLRLHGRWVCSVHLNVQNTRFKGREDIILPDGVEDTRRIEDRPTLNVRDVYPNRRARRAARAM
jgi:hypothetical protein